MPTIITRGALGAKGFGLLSGNTSIYGQEAFTTPGTYTWIAPAGVTSVAVVCVGGGGAGGR